MEKDLAISFCDALNEKFCMQEDLDGLENIIILKNTLSQPQSCDQKRIIGLDHCNIQNSGEDGEIKKLCPRVEELDLSSNRLTDWNQVLCISKQLDHLKFLNLSHNSFDKSSLPNHVSNFQDGVLRKLILNNTRTDVEALTRLLQCFPNINELHLSLNGVSVVPDNLRVTYNSLKTLHFAKNLVQDWREIEHIGRIFPYLTVLNICENPIESIPDDIEPDVCFPCLEKLNIMDTNISDWHSVDNLRKFPNLSDVRIKGSPVYRRLSTHKENRKMIVARLPNVESLNASRVGGEEREDAERMFIRFYMHEEEKPSRYFELTAVYGELDDLAEVNMKKDNICNVLINGDVESSFLMQVDLRRTVKDLRKELASRLDLKVKQFRLIHFEQEENILAVFGGIPMREWYKTLSQYYVTEGNSIQVVRLDLLK